MRALASMRHSKWSAGPFRWPAANRFSSVNRTYNRLHPARRVRRISAKSRLGPILA
jgi:hypothetical protein